MENAERTVVQAVPAPEQPMDVTPAAPDENEFEDDDEALAYPLSVYINGKLSARVDSEEAAWDVIGKSTFGSLYEVRDANGGPCYDFIPY